MVAKTVSKLNSALLWMRLDRVAEFRFSFTVRHNFIKNLKQNEVSNKF